MPAKKQKKNKPKTSKAKKAARKANKPQGHYCHVCGEHKANEKFSGKGHAAHICKACAALTPAERSEMETVNKIGNMAFHYLNENEINWLRKRLKDPRPEVQEAAREAHNIKFPRYERNQIKKGMTAHSLEFFIHGEVWSEWGDEITVNMRVFMENTGELRRIDYDLPEGEQEASIKIEAPEAKKFLKAIIHELDALFWDEDLSDAGPDDYDEFDPYLDEDDEDVDSEGNDENTEPSPEPETPATPKKPIWSLSLELNNGKFKDITFYNQMHDAPQELFWLLMEWFEPIDLVDEDFEDEESEAAGETER